MIFLLLQTVLSLITVDLASNTRVIWSRQENSIGIRLQCPTTGWVAFGWKKENGLMPGAMSIIGWANSDGSFHLTKRQIGGYQMPAMQDRNVRGNVTVSDSTVMSFELDLDSNGIDDGDYHLLWAYGNTKGNNENGNIAKHIAKDSIKVNFVREQVSKQGLTTEGVKKIHGFLMGFAWMVCIPIGSFIAFFMKEHHGWISSKWFLLHILCQSMGILSTFAGFGLMMWYYKRIDFGFHQVGGLIVMSLVLLQTFLGVMAHFQYNPERKEIPWPDKMHSYVGIVLLTLAWVNCGSGLFILGSSPGANYFYLVFGCIFVIVPFIVAGITKRQLGSSAKNHFMFGFLTIGTILLFSFLIVIIADTTLQYQESISRIPAYQPPRSCSVPGCFTTDMVVRNAKVPRKETSYICRVFEFPTDGPYHVVGLDALIDNSKYVHHMILFAVSRLEARNLPRDDFFQCETMIRTSGGPIAGWSKGADDLNTPPGIGIPVGDYTPNEVGIVQIHYDNPSYDVEQFDHSGFRVYMTKQLQPNNAGLLVSGTISIDIPPQLPKFQKESICKVSDVSSTPLRLVSFTPHAHRLGRRIFIEIIRDGQITRLPTIDGTIEPVISSNVTDFWLDETNSSVIMGSRDFKFDDQQTVFFQNHIPLFSNDTIRTICEFDSTSKSSTTYFSESSSQGEMCEVYLLAYPITRGKMVCPDVKFKNSDPILSDEIPRASDFSWYSYNGFIVFGIFWFITNCFYSFFAWIAPDRWSSMNSDQKKSCAFYFIPVVVFTGTLYIISLSKPFRLQPSLLDVQMVRIASLIISCAYSFELAYRQLRKILILHHVLTIFIVCFLLESGYTTGNMAYLRIGYLWTLHALTEPTTFLGLFFHKFKLPYPAMITLYFATVQVFITKMVVNGFLSFYWYVEILPYSGLSPWYTSTTVIFPLVMSLLAAVQFYDAYVTFVIAEKNRRKIQAQRDKVEDKVSEDGITEDGITDDGTTEKESIE